MQWMTKLTGALFLSLAACAAPEREPEAPADPPGRALNVGFLIVDGVYNTELTAPFDVFQHTIFHTDPGMRVFTVAPSRESVRTFEGLRILPDFDYASAPPIDVLVVPSAEHSLDTDLEDASMIAWVRDVGLRARYVVSLCDGAFVLAQAGLLDGRASTTFPADVPAYRDRFPHLDVREDVSFVHDGPALTSAGGALSFDVAMYLCEQLYGARAARGIGGGLCIEWDAEAIPHVAVER